MCFKCLGVIEYGVDNGVDRKQIIFYRQQQNIIPILYEINGKWRKKSSVAVWVSVCKECIMVTVKDESSVIDNNEIFLL